MVWSCRRSSTTCGTGAFSPNLHSFAGGHSSSLHSPPGCSHNLKDHSHVPVLSGPHRSVPGERVQHTFTNGRSLQTIRRAEASTAVMEKRVLTNQALSKFTRRVTAAIVKAASICRDKTSVLVHLRATLSQVLPQLVRPQTLATTCSVTTLLKTHQLESFEVSALSNTCDRQEREREWIIKKNF